MKQAWRRYCHARRCSTTRADGSSSCTPRVRGDAERLQVRMRQTPPVARCASHPPKRAERRCGAGAVADATGGRAPPKVRHEPVAAVQRQPLGRWPVPGSRVGVSLVWASVLRLFVAAGGRLRRALVSRRCTLDSLLGGNTSKGSTCDAADDRPWRTTDDRACHFARDGADNGATKRSFRVRRRSIRCRALWACRCRLLRFRARDARGSVHDSSFGVVGRGAIARVGLASGLARSRQPVYGPRVQALCVGGVSAASTTVRKRRSS